MFSFFQKSKEETKEKALIKIYEELSKQEDFFKINSIKAIAYDDCEIELSFSFGEYSGTANLELINSSGENIISIEKENVFEKIKEEKMEPIEFLNSNFGLANTLLIGLSQVSVKLYNGNDYKKSKKDDEFFAMQILEDNMEIETNCKIQVLNDFIKENFLKFIEQTTEETKARLISEFLVLTQKEQIEQDELIDKELSKLLKLKPLDEDMQTKFKILKQIEGIYENIKTEHSNILELRKEFFSI